MEFSGSVHSRMIIPRVTTTPRETQGERRVSGWDRMTVDTLKDCNKKHLAQLAKDRGIPGWHAMRKDQLIRALTAPRTSSRPKSGTKATTATARKDGARAASANGHSNGHAGSVVASPRAA